MEAVGSFSDGRTLCVCARALSCVLVCVCVYACMRVCVCAPRVVFVPGTDSRAQVRIREMQLTTSRNGGIGNGCLHEM